tara:strand:- start:65 stop:262 length:198 start_codon:yes stop_codon:yes gene_type:complete
MNRKSQKKYWAMNAIKKSDDPDKVTCSVCGQPFGKNDVNAKKDMKIGITENMKKSMQQKTKLGVM